MFETIGMVLSRIHVTSSQGEAPKDFHQYF